MVKILIPNAVKRKPNCIYHINQEGDIIEEQRFESDAAAIDSHDSNDSSFNNSDDKTEIKNMQILKIMSNSDKLNSFKKIRIRALRNLLQLLQLEIYDVNEIMKKLNCSRRTAYDYLNVISVLK